MEYNRSSLYWPILLLILPKEMLLSFSIGTFWTNHDVSKRKPNYELLLHFVKANNLGVK